MARILIIDDDPYIQEVLADNAEKLGHEPAAVGTLADGWRQLDASAFDLVFLDVRLPDGNGLEALGRIRQYRFEPEVVIVTGVGETDGAELALRSGAWDYLQKPLTQQEIRLQLRRILEYREKTGPKKQTVALKRDILIGNSSAIRACLDQVAQCADSDSNLLISGETGTGKELFARITHENSAVCQKPFVVVDCAALPEQLVESLLFGHEKGAFTGADRARKGLIAEAGGGTLFLDEVGELPLSVQKAFLRVLQEHRVRPVGASQEFDCAFRLISATNRNLDQMVANGEFRKDLLYRLRTFAIELPPLRERKSDINDLTLHYSYQFCQKHGMEMKGMTPEFLEILSGYDWPGNVRELISALETAVLADPDNPVLFPMHLPARIRLETIQRAIHQKRVRQQSPDSQPASDSVDRPGRLFSPTCQPALKEYRESILEAAESDYLSQLMGLVGGDIQKACQISGLSQSRLYFLLKKYNISR